jgi:hypothetical protein
MVSLDFSSILATASSICGRSRIKLTLVRLRKHFILSVIRQVFLPLFRFMYLKRTCLNFDSSLGNNMTIHLRTTPSLRKKSRMTKKQRQLLAQVNEERRKNGEKPLTTLKTPKLDKQNFKSTNSLPNYGWNPRGAAASTAHIPSKIHDAPSDANSTGRDTMMDKVRRGDITGAAADEIVRKSKCLAPAYNKGAVQYVGDADAARDAGKKV